jgi:hypothetical protein
LEIGVFVFMVVESRAYNNEQDHPRVMAFLRATYAETGNLENWLPPRFENNSRDMDSGIWVWENNEALVGLVVPESPLLYFVQLQPRYMQLYPEMIQWIEEYSRNTWRKEDAVLKIIEMEGNQKKEKVLHEHGFTRGQIYGIFRIRAFDALIPNFELPEGFKIRSVTAEDFDEIASCIRQVFGHGARAEYVLAPYDAEYVKADMLNPDYVSWKERLDKPYKSWVERRKEKGLPVPERMHGVC